MQNRQHGLWPSFTLGTTAEPYQPVRCWIKNEKIGQPEIVVFTLLSLNIPANIWQAVLFGYLDTSGQCQKLTCNKLRLGVDCGINPPFALDTQHISLRFITQDVWTTQT